MQFTAQQIALLIAADIEGDELIAISSFGKIEEAKAGQLAFLSNPKYEEYLYSTQASIIIINKSQELKQPITATLLRVDDAYAALAKYQEFQQMQLQGIQQPNYISESASIGENVFVGAFCYIGNNVSIGNNTKLYPGVYIGDNTKIGSDSILYPSVKIYHDCLIGNKVIVHAGTVIGSDGFGFAPMADGTFKKIPQMGNVVIEDDVEIGANTTIDRATMGSTIIRTGAKLDNLLQLAHNVEVGKNTVIAAQTGISGSAKIGDNVMIGGQAGIVGHITIANGTKINGKSGVTKSVKEPNTSLTGIPAIEYTTSLRLQALNRRLPEMEKRIKELEKKIELLLKEKENY